MSTRMFLFLLLAGFPLVSSDKTFSVAWNLAAVINSKDIPENTAISQVPDPSFNYNGKYTMRIVLFSTEILNRGDLQKMQVLDNGVYQKTLYDIYMTNQNSGLVGSNFTIKNQNNAYSSGFAVIISQAYTFQSPITLIPAVNTNVTEIYASTSAAEAVFHQILDYNSGFNYFVPTVLTNMKISTSGQVRIYAGCVTTNYATTLLATISADNIQDYHDLAINGQCRTFVVSNGTFSYYKMDYYKADFHNRIGQKGVVMWDTFPYPNDGPSGSRNALIQSPDVINTMIAVDYQVMFIAADVEIDLEQDIRGTDSTNKTLTTSDIGTTYQSVSTFQQYLKFTVPHGSRGVLLRYTVRETSASISPLNFSLVAGFLTLYRVLSM